MPVGLWGHNSRYVIELYRGPRGFDCNACYLLLCSSVVVVVGCAVLTVGDHGEC